MIEKKLLQWQNIVRKLSFVIKYEMLLKNVKIRLYVLD